MNNTPQAQPSYSGVGYLVVKVSTARGAIPLENASVYIRGAERENSDIIYSLKTNSDGLTEKISLPAPARALSEVYGNIKPYALYDVDVFKEGYTDLSFTNVAVFESITSLQPAIMIPRPDNEYNDSYEPTQNQNPSDIGEII